jgi:uncharacterized protein
MKEKKADPENKRSWARLCLNESRKETEIASKGGKAAHQLGTAHKWTNDEMRLVGQKGGEISYRSSKNISRKTTQR